MPTFNWQDFFTQWNQELLEDEKLRENLPPDVRAAGWLGYPGASEEQLAQLEARFCFPLPPSYREFLAFSNGWPDLSLFAHLSSVEEIGWLRKRNREVIKIWKENEPDIWATLEIGVNVGHWSDLYLLNPLDISPEGEWEAWFFASWVPGVQRYRSFWELMQHEHKIFLELRDLNQRTPHPSQDHAAPTKRDMPS